MIQPDDLKSDEPLFWSPGTGIEVWGMFCAAIAGDLETVKRLVNKDPSPRGHALHAAVCNGHIEVVKLLLEKGAYPSVEIESSADTLSAAIRHSNQPMIDLLCSYGASRPVHLLAYYGDIHTARIPQRPSTLKRCAMPRKAATGDSSV